MKCCSYLMHGLLFARNAIYTCPNLYCMNSDDKIISDYHGELPVTEKILEYKRRKIQEFKDGKIPECCQNCPECREDDWDNTISINQYVFKHETKCSSNCIYCESTGNKDWYNSFEPYKIMPILKELNNQGLLSFDGYTAFWCGEITELAEFDEIADFFLQNKQRYYHVHTSGINYSKSLERFLAESAAEIVVVLDSSDADSYFRMKKLDKFDLVVENIKKYLYAKKDYNTVSTKYVFSPGINDSQKQVEDWLELVFSLGMKKVVMDLDGNFLYYNKKSMPENLVTIVDYVKNFCLEHGLQYEIYGILSDFLNNLGTKYEISHTIQQKEYFSCEECFHSLTFMPEGLRHCMHAAPQYAPAVISVTDDKLLSPDEIFRLKEEIEQDRMNGVISDFCKKCVMASKKCHNNERFINKIQISHLTDCNADCAFCYNQFIERHFKPYKILPQLEQFKDYFKNGCQMLFGGGEPTIWDEFEDIIDFALREEFLNISIATNGSVFSEKLAEAIRAGKAQVAVTTDVADKETFEKLKGLDFDVVIENLKKYLACDKNKKLVTCKMIILPFVNDSEVEIEKWINFHADLGIKKFAFDIESIYFLGNREHINPKYKQLLQFASNCIAKKGLECIYYSFAEQMKYDDRV